MKVLEFMNEAYSKDLIKSNKRKEVKYKNIFEFGAGSYVISIYFPKNLKQLSDADEALRRGYFPYSKPNIFSIEFSKFKAEQRENFTLGNMRHLADLVLDEIDLINISDLDEYMFAYVPSGIHWTHSPTNDNIIIAMQFYKKLKK